MLLQVLIGGGHLGRAFPEINRAAVRIAGLRRSAETVGALVAKYDRGDDENARPYRLITGMHPRRDDTSTADDDGEEP